MRKYAATLKRLVKLGYPRDKALLVVASAWGLEPEQIVILDRLTK